MEVALRFLVNSTQSNWAEQLKTAEATFNNTPARATTKTPNELISGKSLRLDLKAATADVLVTSTPAECIAEKRELARQEAAIAIAFAQKAMARYYNSKHDRGDFSSGWVFLKLGDGYKIPAAHKAKIAPQRIGPFKILEIPSWSRQIVPTRVTQPLRDSSGDIYRASGTCPSARLRPIG
jgi:hypothetical protein